MHAPFTANGIFGSRHFFFLSGGGGGGGGGGCGEDDGEDDDDDGADHVHADFCRSDMETLVHILFRRRGPERTGFLCTVEHGSACELCGSRLD